MKISGSVPDTFGPARRRQVTADVVRYLKTVEPATVFDRPDAELFDIADRAIDFARHLGVTQIAAFKRFTYLWFLSDGTLPDLQEPVDFIRFGGRDPNAQVKRLMEETIAAIKSSDTIGTGQ